MWRHISLSAVDRRATVLPFPPEKPAPFGRGLASTLLSTHPEYEFVIANSLLAGTKIPLLTHVCMGGRTPLFEKQPDISIAPGAAIKLSNTGGLVGFRMASMGIGSVSLEAYDTPTVAPVVAVLLPDGCRFEEVDGLEGLSPASAAALLHRRFGNNCTVLLAGPAARLGYAMAQLMISDHPEKGLRLSGRGGPAAAFARCGVSALILGGKKERAAWRGLPGASGRVNAFLKAAVTSFKENSESKPDNTPSTTGTDEKARLKKTYGGAFAPCFTRRMDCKDRCPIGRLRRDSRPDPVNILPHGDKPSFPGSAEEAATFLQDCNRLGIDAHDAVRTLDMALSMSLVPSSQEFLRHLEDATTLGHRLGQGSRLFAASRATWLSPSDHSRLDGGEKSAGRHTKTKEEKERLAALDCLGLCVAASGMLTAAEGREALIRLLDMTAPGEPWSEERIIRLGQETLEQEAGLARKGRLGEVTENPCPERN